MTLIAANQSLDSEVLIDLIQIKTNDFDIKICNYGSVSFGGVFYQGYPCQLGSFGRSGESVEARTSLIVSDISGLVGDIIDAHEVIKAEVAVKQTLPMFLDGQPTADSSQFFPLLLEVSQYTGEYQNQFSFALSPYSLERKKLPARTYSKRCQYTLSDGDCQASTNVHFDIFGQTTTSDKRACRKDLEMCKQYHSHTLKFGGFPAVARIRG